MWATRYVEMMRLGQAEIEWFCETDEPETPTAGLFGPRRSRGSVYPSRLTNCSQPTEEPISTLVRLMTQCWQHSQRSETEVGV